MNEIQRPIVTHSGSQVTSHNFGNATPRLQTISRCVKMNQRIASQIFASKKLEMKHQVIIKAPPLPQMKNAATSCKPILHTKGVTCRPRLITKETQTDEIKEKIIVVPVPVPIYIPVPMPMYSVPLPVPIPFPLPIAVPVFIPTTQNTTSDILKELKKFQGKSPKDPPEKEFPMMNEIVAREDTVETAYLESKENDDNDAGIGGGISSEIVDTGNTSGNDILQMAFKMATEIDEPLMDFEKELPQYTIMLNQKRDDTGAVLGTNESVGDQQQSVSSLNDQPNIPIRERKRPNRQLRNKNHAVKRGRGISSHEEMPPLFPLQPVQPREPIKNSNICLKYTLGINAWKQWVIKRNAELKRSSSSGKLIKEEILRLTDNELNYSLCLFIKQIRKPDGTEYAPDIIYYFCLGIQQHLFENGRNTNIFTDASYEKFTDCLDKIACNFSVIYSDMSYIVTRVEEEHLWESRQLGAHSPYALLTSLIYFNTKYFKLTTVDEHMQLSFCHVVKRWKRSSNQLDTLKITEARNRVLSFCPSQKYLDSNNQKEKVYEQQENKENPLRCPVKLFEFYISKCPENMKTRSDLFYILPETSCIPESPVWYSGMALDRKALEKILNRVKMMKEIIYALLHND